MERNNPPISRSFFYVTEEEPIVLSKALFDTLLRQPKPTDLIALYSFYYYTAKWQKTNQVKATTNYAAKGLSITIHRIRNAKKRLKELGLVEDVQRRSAGNRIIAHYIKINFIWKQTTLEQTKFHPTEKVLPGKHHPLEKPGSNALSSVSKNALSSVSKKRKIFLGEFPVKLKESETFQTAWADWACHRKEIGKELTKTSVTRQANFLSNYTPKQAAEIINKSIQNGWTGLFPPKNSNKPNQEEQHEYSMEELEELRNGPDGYKWVGIDLD